MMEIELREQVQILLGEVKILESDIRIAENNLKSMRKIRRKTNQKIYNLQKKLEKQSNESVSGVSKP